MFGQHEFLQESVVVCQNGQHEFLQRVLLLLFVKIYNFFSSAGVEESKPTEETWSLAAYLLSSSAGTHDFISCSRECEWKLFKLLTQLIKEPVTNSPHFSLPRAADRQPH
jgi:hypothetical protein